MLVQSMAFAVLATLTIAIFFPNDAAAWTLQHGPPVDDVFIPLEMFADDDEDDTGHQQEEYDEEQEEEDEDEEQVGIGNSELVAELVFDDENGRSRYRRRVMPIRCRGVGNQLQKICCATGWSRCCPCKRKRRRYE